jgi:hypothetical protein
VIGYGAYLLKRLETSSLNKKVQASIFEQHLTYLIGELDRLTSNVSDIIREPLHKQSKERILQPKIPGQESVLEESMFAFDLTWDYPLLLNFLADVFKLQLCTEKIGGMLNKLIFPLLDSENYPQLHSNRLLLALALTKLNNETIKPLQDGEGSGTTDPCLSIEIGKINKKLFSEISRETVSKELKPNCAFLRNGTMGIAWIYSRLFILTADPLLKTEWEYWKEESFTLKESDQGYAGFIVEKQAEDKAFGLLNGLAGISLISCDFTLCPDASITN